MLVIKNKRFKSRDLVYLSLRPSSWPTGGSQWVLLTLWNISVSSQLFPKVSQQQTLCKTWGGAINIPWTSLSSGSCQVLNVRYHKDVLLHAQNKTERERIQLSLSYTLWMLELRLKIQNWKCQQWFYQSISLLHRTKRTC